MNLRLEFAETIYKISKKDKRLSVVVGDISHGIFKKFREKSPSKYFNIGICEPSMVSFSSGLAKAGLIPVIHTIAPFLIERCVEQIKLGFGYNKLNGNFVSVGGSYDYSKLGCTHHTYSDFSIIKNIPNTRIFYPSGLNEFSNLFKQSYNKNYINYFRLPAKMHTENFSSKQIRVGKAIKVTSGNKLTICCFGPFLTDLKEIVKKFKKKKINIELLYYPTIKPFDFETLKKIIKKTKKILVIEEHCTNGGASGYVQEVLIKNKIYNSFFLTLPNKFIDGYGEYEDLAKKVGFTKDNFIKKIKLLLNKS